ncbi:hypothetical protein ACIBF1_01280 [Spirillospora sp. NPDC050679]
MSGPASAVWLRGQVMEIGAAIFPDGPPVVADAWSDAVPVGDGRRHLVLAALGGDGRPAGPEVFARLLRAFADTGWRSHGPRRKDGETWAGATLEGFGARLYEGAGPGVLQVLAWTPAIYPEGGHVQPAHTVGTVTHGLLCPECEGLGACQTCEGTARLDGRRCPECTAGNHGPGYCSYCGPSGTLQPDGLPAWLEGQFPGLALPEAEESLTAPTNTAAFIDAVRRACGTCGEVRCAYRNVVTEAEGRLRSRFFGRCPRCGAERAYVYRLSLVRGRL